MNIGDVAKRSGLPAKTIRYYEDIGLISPLRDANSYRSFRDSDLHKLTFLGHARALGPQKHCRKLSCWRRAKAILAPLRLNQPPFLHKPRQRAIGRLVGQTQALCELHDGT